MEKYVDNEKLLPKEQRGCSSGTKECKDQLLISKVILRECKSRGGKVSVWHGLIFRKLLTGCHTAG